MFSDFGSIAKFVSKSIIGGEIALGGESGGGEMTVGGEFAGGESSLWRDDRKPYHL